MSIIANKQIVASYSQALRDGEIDSLSQVKTGDPD